MTNFDTHQAQHQEHQRQLEREAAIAGLVQEAEVALGEMHRALGHRMGRPGGYDGAGFSPHMCPESVCMKLADALAAYRAATGEVT